MRRARTSAAAILFASVLAISGHAGAQTVLCDGRVATIVGTPDDDSIIGTSGDDVIFAMQGDDWIDSLGGDDVICAGQGNDNVAGGEGFDIIFGAQGDDTLFAADRGVNGSGREDVRGARMFGGKGSDIMHGSDRWDRMQGGPGDDVLYGYEGRDWLRGGADRDQVNGGAAKDDVHGGNGMDRLTVTNGDVVRGGAGADWCVITGPAETLISCGQNRYEASVSQRTISAGDHLVPQEVPYGFYRTTGYYELRDAEDRIVVNDFQFDEGPTVALVDERGATVDFRSSATRVEASGPIDPFVYDNGQVLIGLDLAPGTYRANPVGAFDRTALTIFDGQGRLIDIVASQGSSVLVVPPEGVLLDFIGRLERIE